MLNESPYPRSRRSWSGEGRLLLQLNRAIFALPILVALRPIPLPSALLLNHYSLRGRKFDHVKRRIVPDYCRAAPETVVCA